MVDRFYEYDVTVTATKTATISVGDWFDSEPTEDEVLSMLPRHVFHFGYDAREEYDIELVRIEGEA
jgi:hypothetical protein